MNGVMETDREKKIILYKLYNMIFQKYIITYRVSENLSITSYF